MGDRLMLGAVSVVVLVLLSMAALAATIIFRKRMSDEAAHVFFGFIPLELFIIFFLFVPFLLSLNYILT